MKFSFPKQKSFLLEVEHNGGLKVMDILQVFYIWIYN